MSHFPNEVDAHTPRCISTINGACPTPQSLSQNCNLAEANTRYQGKPKLHSCNHSLASFFLPDLPRVPSVHVVNHATCLCICKIQSIGAGCGDSHEAMTMIISHWQRWREALPPFELPILKGTSCLGKRTGYKSNSRPLSQRARKDYRKLDLLVASSKTVAPFLLLVSHTTASRVSVGDFIASFYGGQVGTSTIVICRTFCYENQ